MPSIRDTIGSSNGEYECQNCNSFNGDLEEWDAESKNGGGKYYNCPECGSREWMWKPGETVIHVN